MFPQSGMRTRNSRDELIKFLYFCLYAQGVPFLLCILTAVVDSTRPEGKVLLLLLFLL